MAKNHPVYTHTVGIYNVYMGEEGPLCTLLGKRVPTSLSCRLGSPVFRSGTEIASGNQMCRLNCEYLLPAGGASRSIAPNLIHTSCDGTILAGVFEYSDAINNPDGNLLLSQEITSEHK